MIVKLPWLLKLKAKLAGLSPDVDPGATTILGLFIVVGEEGTTSTAAIMHERIHLAQWRELFFIGYPPVFYSIYFYRRFWKGLSAELAYLHHPMEAEAYRFMDDESYLSRRPRFAWTELVVQS